ncbi:MAG TPA: hypothetical protein VGQ73_02205 [Gemmatimonadales bacterium]|jgi:hypothetical protein|nr:hypothetical protein [Gemmatimonadales bacterium]
MLSEYRLLTICALLGGATVGTARAQTPEPRPRPTPDRIMRAPFPRFEYRIPRMTMRMMPRMRLDAGQFRLRALERSFDRMDRLRIRQFALQDRLREREFARWDQAMRRPFELRERAMTRLRERMERLPTMRPFVLRRRSRTI